MKSISIPIPTLKRLPLYYQQLLLALQQGENFISSVDLGNATGSTPEQVRKDLSFLAGQGKNRVGYDSKKLANIIEEYLGLLEEKEAVLVGAGNLGRALVLFKGFAQYGFKITYLLDNDPQKVGTRVGELFVQPMEELSHLVEHNKILIGIITTPPDAAQGIAENMSAAGIKAIWNFSTAHLHVPDDVMVRNVDLSLELAVISHYLNTLSHPRP